MWIGYIKINGKVSQFFINKNDAEILLVLNQLKEKLKDQNVDFEWDNQFTNKSMNDIINFIYNK